MARAAGGGGGGDAADEDAALAREWAHACLPARFLSARGLGGVFLASDR